ncbi:MAG: DUF805 domain-containing protein [Azospirillaceae bacterium]
MGGIDLNYMFTTADGRIGRLTWWLGVAILYLAGLILYALFGGGGIVPFVLNILLLVAGLMLHIKRFHDRGKSGWWVLILFVPVIGVIWAIVDLGILQGDGGPNRFGELPPERRTA